MEPWRTKGLRSVSVAGCNEVTDKGVQVLCSYSSYLRHDIDQLFYVVVVLHELHHP